ncbi:hypothetical protein BDW74DRAFT_182486 [Aspergillus multicolor]|uniref:uncharacterized protein n=1 Tax=Aspergillus multicolor TaxID=41759 RepID=UPI003CCDDB57
MAAITITDDSIPQLDGRIGVINDTFDELDALVDVNFRDVANFVKLAVSYMRRQRAGGSIVIPAEQGRMRQRSAWRYTTITLVRSLRPVLSEDNITINAVAPAATHTSLLPQNLAKPLIAP